MIVQPGPLLCRVPALEGPWRKLVNGRSFPTPRAVVSLSSIGVPATGKGVYLFQGVITAAPSGGVAQVIIHVDAGTTANRFLIQNAAATALYQLSRNTGGAASTVNGGSLTSGQNFAICMSLDGLGVALASLNGAATTTVSGGPTTGLANLRIGSGLSGNNAMGGFVSNFWVQPDVSFSGAQVQAAAAALA